MFAWSSAGRLRPVRMVWLEHNYNEPKYELIKYRRGRSLNPIPRMKWMPGPKMEDDRERRQRHPGVTGRWPWYKFRRKIVDKKVKKRRWRC